MENCLLRVENLTKSFEGTSVLRGLSLSVAQGEFVTLLGPSGCGKTTTLRIIAGLTAPDQGRVFLDGRDVTSLPPEQRPVNTVFQNYALFPHMNVGRNIGYGLRLQRTPRGEIARRVKEMLELVQLPGIGPATAAGVVAFAFDRPSLYLETNVRTVFLHELFPNREGVRDRELAPLVADTCPEEGARAWYYALLDYGAHLKTQVANPSRRSAHHTRQSAFEGSRRQKRAELVRIVLAAPGIAAPELAGRLDAFEQAAGRPCVDADVFDGIVADLVSEGFFRREGDLLFA